MKALRTIGLVCALLLALSGCEEQVGEDEPEMRKIFAEARALDAEGKYHEAMIRYETILAKHPTWMSTRLNAAMAAYDSAQYQKAVGHFEILYRLAPNDWFVVRKLIQCYERLENKDKVDFYRKKLMDLRATKDGSLLLKKYEGFTRDYIPFGTMHLIGYEFFEPEKHGRLWLFKLEDRHRKHLSMYLVEASPFHDEDDRRLFYITESCKGWMRVWHVGHEGRDYRWSRDVVKDILAGKRRPLVVKPLPVDVEALEVPGDSGPPPGEDAQPGHEGGEGGEGGEGTEDLQEQGGDAKAHGAPKAPRD